VCLERVPLSFVVITEEMFERKTSGSGLENREERSQVSVVLTTQHPLTAKVGTTTLAAVVSRSV
jgi:hypothetical protein